MSLRQQRTIDPDAARRAMDQRWHELPERTRVIDDVTWVSSHLRLRELGITHDELTVELYEREIAQ